MTKVVEESDRASSVILVIQYEGLNGTLEPSDSTYVRLDKRTISVPVVESLIELFNKSYAIYIAKNYDEGFLSVKDTAAVPCSSSDDYNKKTTQQNCV